LFLAGLSSSTAGAQSGIHASGFVATRLDAADAQSSWIDGGFGRLLGGDGSGYDPGVGIEARLQLDYDAGQNWAARVHLGTRLDHDAQGRRLGLVEVFVDRRWSAENQHFQVRLGQFFLPTSLENIEPLWVSPYTLSHSALNSWIGEEFRPVGADLRWRRQFDSGSLLELGLTPFFGNDASGAQLAWRGFAWHDRVSFFGETLPLPPLASLADPARFGDQNDAGSKPFGPDLDGRLGFAARARFGDLLNTWQLTAVDTQGDTRLYRGEYAWRTRFLIAGWEHNPLGEGWGLATELLAGTSRMGRPDVPNANIRMRTGYLLSSYGRDPWRYSLRLEAFDIEDLDRSSAEINDESGHALTLAAMRQIGDWRLGLEFLHVDGERPAALLEGLPLQAGGRQLRFEARYLF
jgi:hypothetical protein